MGLRIDILSNNNFIISYPVAWTLLFIVIATIIVFSMKKIDKKDIF